MRPPLRAASTERGGAECGSPAARPAEWSQFLPQSGRRDRTTRTPLLPAHQVGRASGATARQAQGSPLLLAKRWAAWGGGMSLVPRRCSLQFHKARCASLAWASQMGATHGPTRRFSELSPPRRSETHTCCERRSRRYLGGIGALRGRVLLSPWALRDLPPSVQPAKNAFPTLGVFVRRLDEATEAFVAYRNSRAVRDRVEAVGDDGLAPPQRGIVPIVLARMHHLARRIDLQELA